MAAPTSITLGNAIADWLNDPARAWPLGGWTAARAWDESLDTTDAGDEPIVQVVMEGTQDGRWGSRRDWQEDFTGFIGVRQRYTAAEVMTTLDAKAWIDARVALLEDMKTKMRNLDLSSLFANCAVFIAREGGVGIATLRDRIDQEILRQYTGILEFKFTVRS